LCETLISARVTLPTADLRNGNFSNEEF
jgi:hypothetical protein